MLSASLATRSLPRWYRMMGRRRTARNSADIPWARQHKRLLSLSAVPFYKCTASIPSISRHRLQCYSRNAVPLAVAGISWLPSTVHSTGLCPSKPLHVHGVARVPGYPCKKHMRVHQPCTTSQPAPAHSGR